jgi:hypothetical protein
LSGRFAQYFSHRLESSVASRLLGRASGIAQSSHGVHVAVLGDVSALDRARSRHFQQTMGKYLRTTNPAALAESYDIDVQKYMLRVPLTTTEAVKPVLDDLASRIPKAKDAEPRKFFDDSFVRQMQASGFIDALYR